MPNWWAYILLWGTVFAILLSVVILFKQPPKIDRWRTVQDEHHEPLLTPTVRPLPEGTTVWLVFWGNRLEFCEAFSTRSFALAFANGKIHGIVEWRIVHGEIASTF